jgi:folate-dependent phosphoribosylglycinamide formyltransferase PurN
MKIILVISDLTYVPKNYNDVFEYVVENLRQYLAGVIIIKINKSYVFLKILFLFFAFCNKTAIVLLCNLIDALLKKKKKFLDKLGIPYISIKNINDDFSVAWLKSKSPDLILNMRARCIYKKVVLQIPRLGCINVHHGILPHQKGLFCDLYAIADDEKTGFSIHKMTNYIDQGDIYYREEVEGNKNYIEYLSKVALREKQVIVNFIRDVIRNNNLPNPIINLNEKQKSTLTTTPNFKKIKEFKNKGVIL